VAKAVVTGDKAVDRAFREMGAKLANKMARGAMRRSAKKVAGYAKANLVASPSIVTGELMKSIRVRALKRSRKRIGVKVETQQNETNFGGAPLEFGAKHMPAEPFMRPAVYNHEDEIRGEVIQDIREQIAATKAK
jgi:HK97 gp10 family phage protein